MTRRQTSQRARFQFFRSWIPAHRCEQKWRVSEGPVEYKQQQTDGYQ
jgi:hypothetical protein